MGDLAPVTGSIPRGATPHLCDAGARLTLRHLELESFSNDHSLIFELPPYCE